MTKLKKALQYIPIAIVAVPVIAFYWIFFFLRYVKNPSKYPFEKRYQKIRRMVRVVMFAYFSKHYRYGHKEFNASKDQCMIVCNHLSDLDPLAVVAISERPVTFVAKMEAKDFPFVGTILKILDAFFLDRDNVVSQFSTIKAIVKHLKDENKPPVVVFIEGTRNKRPETHCLDFHPGTLKIASMADVKIIPLSIYGTFRHFTLESYLHHYPVFMDFMNEVKPEEVKETDLNDLAILLKKRVDDRVDEFRIMDKLDIYSQWLTKKRKALETIPDIYVEP